MKTATARQPKVAKVAKVQYRPHIVKESATTYTVPSQTYIYPLYTITHVDGRAVACTCEGHAKWGKTCKHMTLIQGVLDYNAHQQHLRPMVEEAAPVLVAPIELAARRKVAPAFVPAPDALMEAFGF